MQHLLLFILSLFVLACAQPSKTEIAKDNIRKFVAATLPDATTYEPVTYGSLDSAFTAYSGTAEYQRLQKALDEATQKAKEYGEKARYSIYGGDAAGFIQASDRYYRQSDSLAALLKQRTAGFTPAFKGYTLQHTYRSRNASGTIVETTQVFELNPELKVVKSYAPAEPANQ